MGAGPKLSEKVKHFIPSPCPLVAAGALGIFDGENLMDLKIPEWLIAESVDAKIAANKAAKKKRRKK